MGRPAELEAALRALETPKARIPHRLIKRPGPTPGDIAVEGPAAAGTDDAGEGAVKTRREVKAQAHRTLRANQRRPVGTPTKHEVAGAPAPAPGAGVGGLRPTTS